MTARDTKPCPDRRCQRELDHLGMHMSSTWNPALCCEIIDEWGPIVVSDADADKIAELLENPPEPTPAMLRLFKGTP